MSSTTNFPTTVAIDPKSYQLTPAEEVELKELLDREDHRFNGELLGRINSRLAVKMAEVDDGKLKLSFSYRLMHMCVCMCSRGGTQAPVGSWNELCPPGGM
jgi:hypothetical protein